MSYLKHGIERLLQTNFRNLTQLRQNSNFELQTVWIWIESWIIIIPTIPCCGMYRCITIGNLPIQTNCIHRACAFENRIKVQCNYTNGRKCVTYATQIHNYEIWRNCVKIDDYRWCVLSSREFQGDVSSQYAMVSMWGWTSYEEQSTYHWWLIFTTYMQSW